MRFTQLFCSQCKYGQPHSSLALLPQHTSRGEGWFSACSWNKHYVSLKQQHLKFGNILHVCFGILGRREEAMLEAVSCRRGEASQGIISLPFLLLSHSPFTELCMTVALRIFGHGAGLPQAACNLCDRWDVTGEPNRWSGRKKRNQHGWSWSTGMEGSTDTEDWGTMVRWNELCEQW